MITECPHCNDSEGFAVQLEEDAGMFYCPVCGEEFEVDTVNLTHEESACPK